MNRDYRITIAQVLSFLMFCGLIAAPHKVPAQEAELHAVSTDGAEIKYQVIRRVEDTSDRHVLIIGLHANGANEKQLRSLIDISPTFPSTYVSIQGLLPSSTNSFDWYRSASSGNTLVYDADQLHTAVLKLSALIKHLKNQIGSEYTNTVLLGFGEGATLALQTAITNPELADGYIAYAGHLLNERFTQPLQSFGNGAPVLIGYGTLDSQVNEPSVHQTANLLHDWGYDTTLIPYRAPHVVNNSARRAIETWIDKTFSASSDQFQYSSTTDVLPLPTQSPDSNFRRISLQQVFTDATSRGAVFGNVNAQNSLFVFFDYNCPACKAAHHQHEELLEEYPGLNMTMVEVAVLGVNSASASMQSLAVTDSAMYKALLNEAMLYRGTVDSELLNEIASDLEFKIDPITDNKIATAANEANTAALELLKFEGTPGLYLNGETNSGWDEAWIKSQLTE